DEVHLPVAARLHPSAVVVHHDEPGAHVAHGQLVAQRPPDARSGRGQGLEYESRGELGIIPSHLAERGTRSVHQPVALSMILTSTGARRGCDALPEAARLAVWYAAIARTSIRPRSAAAPGAIERTRPDSRSATGAGATTVVVAPDSRSTSCGEKWS